MCRKPVLGDQIASSPVLTLFVLRIAPSATYDLKKSYSENLDQLNPAKARFLKVAASSNTKTTSCSDLLFKSLLQVHNNQIVQNQS